ncbi:MAG: hypothetical protein K6E29_00430 [Cyanobacteria bacterium RUI128]|nr:hypothetical protein [Cyanobacteria bacterium RUI128]
MGNNLIHNYLNNMNTTQVSDQRRRSERSYFPSVSSTMNSFDKESDRLIKPLDGKGHLVNNDLLHAPKEFVRDTVYTTKALTDGVRGKANDHQLGKLNDLGLKLSGIAIATYLMTKKATPKTKAMEFVGFGAFLASMALWPKLALELPARLIHGFNFRQQYIDDQGRKKFVSQDPNYIPFDLYKGDKKSHDLDVIGDRAGIRRDIPNRREAVKDHIRKVSVQNNTLWMLTAGIATPIMTALACNQAEKFITPKAENYSNKKVNQQIDTLDKYITGGMNKAEAQAYEAETLGIATKEGKAIATPTEILLGTLKGKPIKREDIVKLSETLADGFDAEMKDAARADITSLVGGERYVANAKTADRIAESVHSLISAQDAELASKVTPERIKGAVSDGIIKGAVKDMLTSVGFDVVDKEPKFKDSRVSTNFKSIEIGNVDFFRVTPETEHMTPVERLAHNIKSLVMKVNNSNPNEDFIPGMSDLERSNRGLKAAIDEKLIADSDAIARDFYEGNLAISGGRENFVRQSVSGLYKQNAPRGPKYAKLLSDIEGVISADVKGNKGFVISESAAGTIAEASRKIGRFSAIDEVLASAAHFKVEKASETLVANNWNEVSQLLVKQLKLSDSELSMAAKDSEYSRELLSRKLSQICSDETSYSNFLKDMSSKMAELDAKIDAPNQGSTGRMMGKIESGIVKNCTETGNALGALKMSELKKKILSTESEELGTNAGSIMSSKIGRLHSRVEGVHSAYMRILQSAEFFHRAHGYEQAMAAKALPMSEIAAKFGLTEDPKLNEELIKRGKDLLLDAHTNQFYTKMGLQNNKEFFERLMRTVYRPNKPENAWNEGWAQSTNETIAILDGVKESKDSTLSPRRVFEAAERRPLGQKLREHMNQVYSSLGSIERGIVDEGRESVLVNGGVSKAEGRACKRFDLLSKATSELFHDSVKQIYNSRKWMKTFAPILGITTGVTLLAQFFFGKKDPDIKA